MEVHFESWPNKRELPKLLEQRKATGGRVVVYLRVVSFVFVTRVSHHYCLLRSLENRSVRGFSFSGPSLLVGWWSLIGPFSTFYALAHNLLGGIDVTEELTAPPLLKKSKPAPTHDERLFSRARFQLCLIFSLAAAGLVFSWLMMLVITYTK